jgi:phospholipid transport system substrate-binding protein
MMKPTLFAIATVFTLLAGVNPPAYAVECAAGVIPVGCVGPNGAVAAGSRGAAVARSNGARMSSAPDAGTPATGESPVSLVADLGIRVLAAMQIGDTSAAREGQFRQVYRRYFDEEACARSALGSYWQRTTAQQRQEFVRLYEDYVVIGYSIPFGHLGGESFTVLGSERDKQGVIVTSQMNRPDGAAPIEFDWQLSPTSNGYRVTNVIVSGINMSSMQRSDLVSVIQRNGGQMRVLLAALREKNASNGVFR